MTTKIYSKHQLLVLVLLRILIGWHFLYAGLEKVLNPFWTSEGYLRDSKGLASGLFHAIAENTTILASVDFINEWGLLLIGIALITGLFTRIATVCGAVLLLLYFASHPPLVGLEYAISSDGSSLIVNKTLIEMSALLVLHFFPTSTLYGLDRLVSKRVQI